MGERDTSILLKATKGLLQTPPVGDISPIPGSSDRKQVLHSGAWFVVFKHTLFKEKPVIYIMEILTREEFEYYKS